MQTCGPHNTKSKPQEQATYLNAVARLHDPLHYEAERTQVLQTIAGSSSMGPNVPNVNQYMKHASIIKTAASGM